ncbi:hypothetical protein M8J75_001170 [Diaphorina citri]|nr:hypothetical protein M8J75_001170 [Diaphorina citri]
MVTAYSQESRVVKSQAGLLVINKFNIIKSIRVWSRINPLNPEIPPSGYPTPQRTDFLLQKAGEDFRNYRKTGNLEG